MRAILALPALTGDFRHAGGGVLCMSGGHFGGINTGRVKVPADLPAPAARTINMSRLGEALTVTDDPPVAALVVFDANPAASNPDHARVHAGLAREDLFTVVLEQRMTDTALFADIVLPATMQPEHLDLHTSYGHQYVTLNVPAVEPPGECLPNTEIFRGLARALGLDHPRLHESDEEIVRDVLDCEAAREAGITFERLRDEGALRIAERGRARFAEGGFPTPGGRLRLLAPELAEAGADPLVGYTPPHELADAELAQRYPLALLSPASRHVMNSTFASLPWHRDRLGPPRVHLHPRDAERPRHRERRARARPQRPRRIHRRGRDRRRRAAGRRLHVQAAVAAAARAGPARERHDPRARRRSRRQPDVPRQPRRGLPARPRPL